MTQNLPKADIASDVDERIENLLALMSESDFEEIKSLLAIASALSIPKWTATQTTSR